MCVRGWSCFAVSQARGDAMGVRERCKGKNELATGTGYDCTAQQKDFGTTFAPTDRL